MQGMLADINVQEHLPYLRQSLESMDLWSLLEEAEIRFTIFADHDLPRNLDDRSLREFCQKAGWVLFTNDKNNDGPNSLQATMEDSWKIGDLPVLTLSNQGKFVRNGTYASKVAKDVADLLYGIQSGDPLDRLRILVPF